jgi:hypothetical protein
MSATLLSAARPLRISLLAAACLVVLTLTCAADTTVAVVVRGPWAYAETSTNLILIAPVDNDDGHYPPSVFNLGGEVVLNGGKLYKMDFASQIHPTAPQPCGTTPDYGYLAGFDKNKFNSLQTAPPSNIYIISLPVPDSCTATQKFESDIGATYYGSTVNNLIYATDMTFTYTVKDTDKTFRLGGLTYPVEGGNMIDIMMEPTGQITGYCNVDSRHAFQILVQAIGLKLFEDFKEPYDNPNHYRDQECKSLDPQNNGSAAATRAVHALSLLLRHYKYYLNYPTSETRHQVRGEFDAYEDAAKGTPLARNQTLVSGLKTLKKALNKTPAEGALPANGTLQENVDQLVHIFLDGSGACRKAIIQLNPS